MVDKTYGVTIPFAAVGSIRLKKSVEKDMVILIGMPDNTGANSKHFFPSANFISIDL